MSEAPGLPRAEQVYRVRFDECGPDGLLPASGFLRYAQDLAWYHSDSLGFGRQWYAAREMTWLIRALEIELLSSVEYGERLLASTEVVGFRRVWARRRSEMRRESGGPTVARMTIDWVLLGATGAPQRLPEEILAAFNAPRLETFRPLRQRLPPVAHDAALREFRPRRSELDPLAHVNNAAYLDFVDEHLAAAGCASELERLPRRYVAEFVAPAEQGFELVGRLWPAKDGWHYRLESSAGRELLRLIMNRGSRVS